MQILVVSATMMEIDPFLSRRHKADHLVTGVGIAACIYHLTKKFNKTKYDLVIQAGIGGSFGNAVPLGECVVVKKDAFADAGIFSGGSMMNLNDTGLADKNSFPFINGWLVNDHLPLESIYLKAVDAVTVSLVSDHTLPLNDVHLQKYSPQIETMEGAAFHYVCLQEKVNFLQLRAVSNEVGERDKSKWKIKEAIANLDKSMDKIFTALHL